MRRPRLHSEQIYEAMIDDEAFAALPSLLADCFGARSCTVHWRDTQDQAEVLSHSHYFTDAQMLDYAQNYTAFDDWTNRANERQFVNRVWDAGDLVPSGDYARGVFYNEWIRAMGDDTFHCMGSVMETGRGLGIIGLHRGRSQAGFDPDTVAALRRQITPLRRMLAVRARLDRESTKVRSLAALLDRNLAPMFAVDSRSRLVHANAAALAVFIAGGLLDDRRGIIAAHQAPADAEFQAAIARASDPAAAEASTLTLTALDGRKLELTITPVPDGDRRLVMISGRDPDGAIRRALATVDPRDTLAPRELLVAQAVAMGLRNREIAERLGLTEGTVKVYLHNLYAKVGVSSRTELAVRIGRLER